MILLFILFLYLFLRQLVITHIYMKMVEMINLFDKPYFITKHHIVYTILNDEPLYIQFFIHEQKLNQMYHKLIKLYPNTPYTL